MKKQGLIYHHGWPERGEVVVALTRAARLAYHTARMLGSSLIVAGLAGIAFTLQPVVTSEIGYKWYQLTGDFKQGQHIEEQITIKEAQATLENEEKERTRHFAKSLGLDSRFAIYIPKINAKADILENVNPADRSSYMEVLKEGVAHSAGSVFPGVEGATFLFAHSTDAPWNVVSYNAVFYLLRELEPGDEIYIFFLDKLYKYRMKEKRVVEPQDISWLKGAMQGPERLILQTCWPPGTIFKRLIVVAEPVL